MSPKINAAGIHEPDLDPLVKVDVKFWVLNRLADVRMNRHRYLEVLYVHRGAADCQFPSGRLVVPQGSLVLIGNDVFHRVLNGRSAPSKAVALWFERDALGSESAGDTAELVRPFAVRSCEPHRVVTAETGIPIEVIHNLKRIHELLPATSRRARLSVRVYLEFVLTLLANHFAQKECWKTQEEIVDGVRDPGRLKPVLDFIDQRYQEGVGVEEAARIAHMSPSHFMHVFKTVTGQSFISFLQHFRVAKAQSLLAYSKGSLAEIAQQVGYSSQSYFTVLFRKLVGITPREYRRRAAHCRIHSLESRLAPLSKIFQSAAPF